jgi:uncharacterized protein (DUF302 family)
VISRRPGTIVTMKSGINKASHATVAETAAPLIAEVEARGMKLFTTIDHGAKARPTGLVARGRLRGIDALTEAAVGR